jgi:outer membrane protein assembly factor BamB
MRKYIMMTAAAAAVATLAALSPAAAGAASYAPRPGSGALARAQQAAPGAQLWASRYNGPGNGEDDATSVAVRGTRVFVTGSSGTVAYGAATGRQLWVRRGGPSNSVAVNPRGTAVFVTGSSGTVAYRAATGKQLWVRRGGPSNSVAVNPRGTAVYVTGSGVSKTTGELHYLTVAYNAATGKKLWLRRYNGPANRANAFSVAVSPRGTAVFVTGWSAGRTTGTDYATIAYSAATGKKLWLRHYNGPANRDDAALSVAVNPRGTAVRCT